MSKAPHRVDVIVLLKILFFARVTDPLGKTGRESTLIGLEIKHFHFMVCINAVYALSGILGPPRLRWIDFQDRILNSLIASYRAEFT